MYDRAMRRIVLGVCLASAILSFCASAVAHAPGSDGGPTARGCGVLNNVSSFGPVGVGATRVGCSIAREVASGSVRGKRFERWRCTGLRTRFGHCHGRGIRTGARVAWYANH